MKVLERLFYGLYRWYYFVLPPGIRNAISRGGSGLYRHVRNIHFFLFHSRCSLYVIEGKEKHSGVALRTIYAGEEEMLNYLARLIYAGRPVIDRKDDILSWNFNGGHYNRRFKGDMAFVMTSRLFMEKLRKMGYFILPEWIGESMKLDRHSRPWDGLSANTREFVRKTRARIKKYGYSYRVSYDNDDFDNFYRNFYVPSTEDRHKDLAEVQSYDYLKAVFKRGGLLFLHNGAKPLGAVLFIVDSFGVFHFFVWGVLKGEEKHLSDAVGHALYYFSITWASEQGLKEYNFGGSRPFLNDGILQYKKKWGACVQDNPWLTSVVGLKINNIESAGVRSFLENNSFITVEREGPVSFVFRCDEARPTGEDIDAAINRLKLRGLKKMLVLSPAKAGEGAQGRDAARDGGEAYIAEPLSMFTLERTMVS